MEEMSWLLPTKGMKKFVISYYEHGHQVNKSSDSSCPSSTHRIHGVSKMMLQNEPSVTKTSQNENYDRAISLFFQRCNR